MSKFFNLQQAFQYFSSCLMCKREMGMECLTGAPISHVVVDIEFDNYGLGDYHPVITYHIRESSFEEEFKIQTRTNHVHRKIKEHRNEMICDGTNTYIGKSSRSYPQVTGTKYLYLGGSCRQCKQYSYVLRLIVQLDPLALVDIVFNSEVCIFQKDPTEERWELRNIYTTKRTIYAHFAKPERGVIISEAKQDLPLLPLNRDDPSKTLKRVKNLLIFT